ncbi:hypothetical protein Dimus_022999, partial [Dionaea muscipula]
MSDSSDENRTRDPLEPLTTVLWRASPELSLCFVDEEPEVGWKGEGISTLEQGSRLLRIIFVVIE